MTVRIAKSGEACCGNCGAQLVIACTGGCPEPDTEFKENYIASMKKPQGGETPRAGHARLKQPKKPRPTHCHCGDPVAPRLKSGVGRPPTHCEKHMLRGDRRRLWSTERVA